MRTIVFIIIALFTAAISHADVVEEILAKVGDQIITKTDYDTQANRLHDVLSHQMQGVQLEKEYSDEKKNLLNFMIDNMLLEQKAKELNISVDEEVNAAIERLKKENNLEDEQAFLQALQKEGTSLPELKSEFRKRVIQQKVLWNYVQGKVNITEDEIKTYYQQHKGEMVSPASTVIIRYSVDGTDKDALKKEADLAVVALRAGKQLDPTEFPDVKADDNPTELADDDLNPTFATPIKNTAPGSFTDPIETANGWSILKVVERHEPKPISYDDARGKIYETLLQERAQKYQKSFMDDLRKHSYVVVNDQTS
jgi:peptidyl-prolyl cis-trans isomerase SurA